MAGFWQFKKKCLSLDLTWYTTLMKAALVVQAWDDSKQKKVEGLQRRLAIREMRKPGQRWVREKAGMKWLKERRGRK